MITRYAATGSGSTLKRLLTVMTVTLLLAGCARAGSEPLTDVSIGISGQSLLVHLPTILADQLGYYRDEGLNVNLQDLKDGPTAALALENGQVNVVSTHFDNIVRMRADDYDATAFVSMFRLPSIALVVSPKGSRRITSLADLVGATVGVTSLGAPGDFFLKYLLSQHGMTAAAVRVQAIGNDGDAVTAVQRGRVDAAVMVDPSISELQQHAGNLQILVDARTVDGVRKEFGVDNFPATVLGASRKWLNDNDDTARRLGRALTRTLRWMGQHSAAEIAAAMPPAYADGDSEVYVKAIEQAKIALNPDGVLHANGARAAYDVLTRFDPDVSETMIDLGTTYCNDYLSN